MKKSTLFGLWLLAIPFFYQISIVSTLYSSSTMNLDVFPDFLGYILVFLGIENLSYHNPILKSCGNAAVILAIPSFLAFAAQLSPYYITMIAPVSENGTLTGTLAPLAYLLIFIYSVYTQFQPIFMAVTTLFLAVFSFGVMTEIGYRQAQAQPMERFSHKDAYGTWHYSLKAHKIYTLLSAGVGLVYLAQTILLVADQWLQIQFTIMGSIRAGLWILVFIIGIPLCVYWNTAFNMISQPRPEDLPPESEKPEE